MLSTLISKVGIFIGGALIAVAGFFGVSPETPSLGSVVPITPGLFETSLSAPITSSATSMVLASGSLIDGSALTGYVCFTVDSGQPNVEFICGTASSTSITAMVRGINPINGTSSVPSLQFSHRRGANVKITDYPALSIQGRILNGLDGVPNRMYYDAHPCTAMSASTSICDKSYSDNLVNQGAATSSNTVAGITKISVVAVDPNNPIAVGDNDTRVPTQTENDALVGSSSTPSSTNPYITLADVGTTTRANAIVRASSTGKIDNTFITFPTASSSLVSRLYGTSTGPIYSITVPANTVELNSILKVVVPVSVTTSGSGSVSYSIFWGNATSTLTLSCPAVGGGSSITAIGTLNAYISSIASSTVQRLTMFSLLTWGGGAPANPAVVSPNITEATTTITTSTSQPLNITITSTGCSLVTYSGSVEVIK